MPHSNFLIFLGMMTPLSIVKVKQPDLMTAVTVILIVGVVIVAVIVQAEVEAVDEKANGKVKRSPLVQKSLLHPEPLYRKHSERDKNSNSLGTSSRLNLGSLQKDSDKTNFDRSLADKRRLHRELSDLELGELREVVSEEPEETKTLLERVGSFKLSETKLGTIGSRNVELKRKSASKTSPLNARGAPNNADNSSRRYPEPYAEDSFLLHGALQSQVQQSWSGHAQVGSLPNKAVDRSRPGQNEAVYQGNDAEGCGETQKKANINSHHEDPIQKIGSHKVKENKSRKSNALKDASDRKKEASNTQGRKNKRKRCESSSDDNTSYSGYEKEEPELKGPIGRFSQYNVNVQEYHEKYESYCSLNKILESYRNEFRKLGMDLDSAKGRDIERYYGIVEQLRESYSQFGTRHKRLKKIFLVLHEELKHLKQMIKDFAADYTRD